MTLDYDPVAWTANMKYNVTVADIAAQLAGDEAHQQAAILLMFAQDIAAWKEQQSWPMQCRYIADELDSGDRMLIAGVLETLVEHFLENGGDE